MPLYPELKDKLKIVLTNIQPKQVSRVLSSTKNKDLLNNIISVTDFLPIEKTKLAERVYCINNNIFNRLFCPKCKKNYLLFNGSDKWYAQFCSVSCSRSSNSTQEKLKKTTFERYWVEYGSQSEKIKEKVKNTNIKKYWVKSNLMVESIKEQIKKTNLIKYGNEYASQSEIIKNKIMQTNLKNYGVKHIFQVSSVKEKIKATTIKKYWVDSFTKTPEFRIKSKETSIKKYWVNHPMHSEIVKKRIIKTNNKRYNVDYPYQLKEFQEKIKQSNLQKFWVECNLMLESVKSKIKLTNIKKYWYDNPSKCDFIKKKVKSTNLKNFWVEYPMQSNEIKFNVLKKNISKYWYKNISKQDLSKYQLLSDKLNIELSQKIDNNVLKNFYICNKCWESWYISTEDLYNRMIRYWITPCKICVPLNTPYSKIEKQFVNFINTIYQWTVIENNRKILNWKEIDIFLPKESIWIEIHWLYWHSDEYKEKNDHYDKTKLCQEKWIQLFQFFEDEIPQAMMLMYSILANKWVLRDDIDINSINTTYWINIVNKDHLLVKYYARNTIINHIDSKDANEMLEMYHIQWKDISKYRYWLYDENNNLLSLMTFKKMSIDKNQKLSNWQNTYELSRYVTLPGVQIIWGFNKLINAFKKEVKESLIITYSNMRYSSELDNVYLRNWFQNLWFTGINYYYFFEWKKYHRFNFRKDNFYNNILPKYWIEVSSNYKEESESWMIKKLNSFKPIHKIYDCWNIKWILK